MSSVSNTTFVSFTSFEAIFNAALTQYTKRTGKDLRNHPLASKVDNCDNPESILDIFQEQAQTFDEFKNGDTKLFKWLKPVVGVLLETLDGTYSMNGGSISRNGTSPPVYFRCLAASKRPLGVKELAELFAIQPDVDTIPTFDARWRP
jgi:hypothetical protein